MCCIWNTIFIHCFCKEIQMSHKRRVSSAKHQGRRSFTCAFSLFTGSVFLHRLTEYNEINQDSHRRRDQVGQDEGRTGGWNDVRCWETSRDGSFVTLLSASDPIREITGTFYILINHTQSPGFPTAPLDPPYPEVRKTSSALLPLNNTLLCLLIPCHRKNGAQVGVSPGTTSVKARFVCPLTPHSAEFIFGCTCQ